MIRFSLLAAFLALTVTACGEKPTAEITKEEVTVTTEEMTKEIKATAAEMTEEATAAE